MANDKLYLIKPGFIDPNRDDGPFVCPFCNQIEGLLASFPDLTAQLEVEHVDFPRPRAAVIAAIGEANQALPLLVFGDNPPESASRHGEVAYVQDTNQILTLLATRHGFPRPHKFLS